MEEMRSHGAELSNKPRSEQGIPNLATKRSLATLESRFNGEARAEV